jgi:hypothetical protein
MLGSEERGASRTARMRLSSRWMGRLGGFAIACLKAWRLRFFSLPARLAVHGRRGRLRLPVDWPWREEFQILMARLHTIVVPSLT